MWNLSVRHIRHLRIFETALCIDIAERDAPVKQRLDAKPHIPEHPKWPQAQICVTGSKTVDNTDSEV